MAIVGCNLPNRFIEQHDVFFGVAPTLVDLKPKLIEFWPEIAEKLHIDSYRTVSKVGNHRIFVVDAAEKKDNGLHLYFLNLGGYKPDDMKNTIINSLSWLHPWQRLYESVRRMYFGSIIPSRTLIINTE
ncbi:uncharacterized protein DUF1543 [Sphingobacterium alimentarium]|uniref:Uncharacterized protein DUF1543 n=1 Tax=Sphingobacterium alimentarium TaxID=797292 RepID=A0A4R3VR95_9SPHI|nr:uncharacterized protein DUF1543 [Sphingobacterium alimentarium]